MRGRRAARRRPLAIDALRVAVADAAPSGRWSAGFAICGATTNGLIGTHFVPAAHDHGMHETTAAGLLAVVGIFDIVGTIASGWLTDRYDPRLLLGCYYFFRGVGLALLPVLLADAVQPSIVAFVVIYGLDWVATVPPTVALCRQAFGSVRHRRVRLGLRLAPDRCGARVGGRRLHAGPDRHLHDRLVQRSCVVRRGRRDLAAGEQVERLRLSPPAGIRPTSRPNRDTT